MSSKDRCACDPRKVARYDGRKVAALLADAGIVRNRAKIASGPEPLAIDEGDPRSKRPVGRVQQGSELKSRGFGFVGSTIVYAHMQASGMVNDHVVDCFRHREVEKLGQK